MGRNRRQARRSLTDNFDKKVAVSPSRRMPAIGGRGRGDLFVAVTLMTPKTLTKEQRKLLEQLAEVEDMDFQDESFMDKVRNIFG